MSDSVQIKSGARLMPGSYKGTAKTDTVTLRTSGEYDLQDIENVRGSVGNDDVTLSGDLNKNFGVINLGNGNDTLHLGEPKTYSLKLTGVETVTGVLGSTLNIRGAATFSTDGSVSITSSARDAGKQNITFTDLVNDITINLGTGKDVIKFGEGFSFLQNGDGELLVSKGGKTFQLNKGTPTYFT